MQPPVANRWLSADLLQAVQAQRAQSSAVRTQIAPPTSRNEISQTPASVPAAPAESRTPPRKRQARRLARLCSASALLVGSAAFSYLAWSTPGTTFLGAMTPVAKHVLAQLPGAKPSPLLETPAPDVVDNRLLEPQRQRMRDLRAQNNVLADRVKMLQDRLLLETKHETKGQQTLAVTAYREVNASAQLSADNISLR